MWQPKAHQLSTVIRVKKRVGTTVNGAEKVSYIDANPFIDYCQWKGKGGTEGQSSGTYTIHDTAEVVMWYRSDISQKDRLLLNNNPDLAYEIISPVDNVEQRNMWLYFKVKRVSHA